MSLDAAINILQAEVDAFGQGTKRQPRDGDPEWYLLRAKTLGLSSLKRMKQLELGSSAKMADQFHVQCIRHVKAEAA